MNFFILGGFFRVDFPPVRVGPQVKWESPISKPLKCLHLEPGHLNMLAWPPLQSLAVKNNFFMCKFGR